MLRALLVIILGYLIGSIPWGLIIGKIFFHKDIRNYGSGNLGGTNAGRVLGKPIGILVILLDALKALIVMIIVHFVLPGVEQYVGLAVCFGHCFPIFAGFKGGKAVACSYGYLFGLALFVNHEWLFTFILPLACFFVLFIAFHMVSLASMTSLLFAAILIIIFVNAKVGCLVLALSLFVIYRHRKNIERILNHSESKIYLFKKQKSA